MKTEIHSLIRQKERIIIMKKNGTIKEIHVPKPENMRAEAEPKAMIKCLDEITKAKNEGSLSCYISAGRECVSKSIVQKLIDAGYDIYYNHFTFDGSWFIKVFWIDGCCGKIFNESTRQYVCIDDMYTY